MMSLTNKLRLLAAALILGTGSAALAHASLVFGTMETDPLAAGPDGFTLILHMMDPVRTPIEDAVVHAEFRPWPEELADPDAATAAVDNPEAEPAALPDASGVPVHRFAFHETGPGGNYEAEVVLPEPGHYQLLMRDTTYPQEDAIAELYVHIDGETEHPELLFIFPPTDIGGASLGTWLVWLIVIPVAAGIIVTVSVLTGNRNKAKPAA